MFDWEIRSVQIDRINVYINSDLSVDVFASSLNKGFAGYRLPIS